MKKRLVAMFVAILFILYLVPGAFAGAAPLTGSIAVVLENEDKDENIILLSGISVSIYRVASVEDASFEKGLVDDKFSFILVGDFVPFGSPLNIEGGGEHRAKAEDLEKFANDNKLKPIETKITDSEGKVVFEGLKEGLYLIMRGTESLGSPGLYSDYAMTPILVPLPDFTDGSWNIEAYPKTEPPKEPEPVDVVIDGDKIIKSRDNLDFPDKEFTFIAEQVDYLGAIDYTGPGEKLHGESTIMVEGDIETAFAITIEGLLEEESPYYFLITEDQEGDGEDDWSYSKEYYWVEVTVDYNTDDELVAAVTAKLDVDGLVEVISFTNTYGTIVTCEVDKDTIRRTSAAYVSLPGYEGINNVGDPDEMFRYDLNFRSTSNVDAAEFVVDDPLENVKANQVRVEVLWTPIVWGDVDGSFNLWYRTNQTDDGTVYSTVTANPDVREPAFPNTGFKLWAGGLSTTSRTRMDVKDLGLADGEYITAIRFEYGAVKVGFTSMNYSKTSQNGEHRDTSHGPLSLRANNADIIQSVAPPMPPDTINCISGNVIDWTPVSSRPDYAEGAAQATGLQPVSFLVSAARSMYEEDIINSVIARIALGDQRDWDQDAVVTRLISTFGNDIPEFTLPTGSEEMSFIDNAERAGWNIRDGGSLEEFDFMDLDIPLDYMEIDEPDIPTTYREGNGFNYGNIPQTSDSSMLGLWIFLMAASAIGIALLIIVRRKVKN